VFKLAPNCRAWSIVTPVPGMLVAVPAAGHVVRREDHRCGSRRRFEAQHRVLGERRAVAFL